MSLVEIDPSILQTLLRPGRPQTFTVSQEIKRNRGQSTSKFFFLFIKYIWPWWVVFTITLCVDSGVRIFRSAGEVRETVYTYKINWSEIAFCHLRNDQPERFLKCFQSCKIIQAYELSLFLQINKFTNPHVSLFSGIRSVYQISLLKERTTEKYHEIIHYCSNLNFYIVSVEI